MNDERLIKAVFAAGFRAGRECGERNAVAYERGRMEPEPKRPEDWWDLYIARRINSDTWPFNPSNPDDWGSL